MIKINSLILHCQKLEKETLEKFVSLKFEAL